MVGTRKDIFLSLIFAFRSNPKM